MSIGHRTAGRVCFWTSAVQEVLLYAWAGYYDISRSAAVEMIVREALSRRINDGDRLGEVLGEVQSDFTARHPLAAAKDMSRREVDKALRKSAHEE